MILMRFGLWFFIYSVVGWIYESLLFSFEEKKFINRGFLNGPYCPVYGFGALLDILLIGRIDNFALLFLAGILITCSLEYMTAVLLENIFHAKWWDYSNYKFNLQGRVCLIGALVFGLFTVVLIKVIHPFISMQTDMLTDTALSGISLIIVLAVITDAIYTVVHLKGFNKKLGELYRNLNDTVATSAIGTLRAQIGDAYANSQFRERMERFVGTLNRQELRIILSFPKLQSTIYNATIHRVYEFLEKKRGAKK